MRRVTRLVPRAHHRTQPINQSITNLLMYRLFLPPVTTNKVPYPPVSLFLSAGLRASPRDGPSRLNSHRADFIINKDANGMINPAQTLVVDVTITDPLTKITNREGGPLVETTRR